ncbi:MAG: hypothetical protein H7839_10605 [Magnetococcus sp. YQC-5]
MIEWIFHLFNHPITPRITAELIPVLITATPMMPSVNKVTRPPAMQTTPARQIMATTAKGITSAHQGCLLLLDRYLHKDPCPPVCLVNAIWSSSLESYGP